jgi:WD40 repeat protein
MPAALSPTGRLVAISNHRRLFAHGRPEALLVYSDSGALQHTLTIPAEAEIQSVQFISERRLMMSQAWVEHNIRTSCHVIWDAASGQKVLDLPPGEAVRVSGDGRVVASARLTTRGQIPDRSQVPTGLRIWKVESGAAVQAVESPAPIRDFALRPDGARVLAALGDRLIEWDVASGARVWDVQKTEHPFATVVYSPAGKRRYATIEIPNGVDDDVDRHLRGWDVSTGQSLPIADYAFASYNGTERLFLFPEGDRFVELESAFVVRDIGTGKGLQTAPAYRPPQREAAIMPDGRKFLTGYWLSDAESGEQRRWSIPGADYRFIQAGRTLFSGDHMGVFLTHVRSGITFWKYRMDSSYVPTDVAASEDGERIVFAYRFGSQPSESRILVVDPRRPDQPWIIPEYASAVAVTPDHTRFVAASQTAISEWANDTQAGPTALWATPGRVLFANYSRDGAKLLVGGTSGNVDQRGLPDEDDPGWAAVLAVGTRQVVSLTGHTAPVTTGEFSLDGARCATGSLDRTIRLWNVSTGTALHVFRGHRGPINRIAYDPLGKRILSAAGDGAAFWDIAGNVDPGDPPRPVAATFESIVSINAWAPIAKQSIDRDLFAPEERAGTPADPAQGTAEWSVVKLGQVDRDSNIPHDWLTLARSTRQLGEYRRVAQAGVFANYHLRGESRDGRRRVYSSHREREILVAESNGTVLSTWKCPFKKEAVAISASGTEVAIVTEVERAANPFDPGRYAVSIYDAVTGEARRTFDDVRSRYVQSLKMDPQEETILLQVDNNSLELRDFRSGKRLATSKSDPGGGGLQSAYSLDGRFVVTCKYPDPVLYLRDAKTFEDVKPLTNDLPVRWFRLTPDGRHVLAGQPYLEHRPLVTKWELETGRRVWTRAGPASEEGEFSPSGRYYLTKSGWYLWTLWDVLTGSPRCVVVSKNEIRLDDHALVWADDERSLHLGSPAGQQLWSWDE